MKSLSLVISLVFLLTPVLCQNKIDASSNELPKDLELVENWNRTLGESGIRTRRLFIYLPESSFNEKNLSLIFAKFQKEYCEPYMLTIYVYSDKLMLDKKIKFDKSGVLIDFATTEAGRKGARKYYEEVLGPPSGYYQAEYARYAQYERFDFTPDKNSPRQTRVLIADPEGGQPNRNVCLAAQKR